MDTPHWPQFGGGGVVVKEMAVEGSSKSNNNNNNNNNNLIERKTRAGAQKEQVLKCPRCTSSNTKFCYYNNYSLSQPRYFCKACRRYWTEGGSLRNVPVGGGSRKNKRSSLSSSASADHKIKINGSDENPNHKIIHHHPHQDLNLTIFPPTSSSSSQSHLLGSFMGPAAAAANGCGIYNGGGGFGNLHDELKPSLSFSLEGFESGGGGYGDLHHHHHHHHHHHQQDQTAVMFPIEDLKQTNGAAAAAFDHQNRGGDSSGYWSNGMLGGGSW